MDKNPSTATRAVLYARISQDELGTAAGVGRQLEDARAFADLRGYEIVDEYVENDVSAFAHRPQYERMMEDIARGGVEVIVVYSTSRLWRNRTQRGAAIDTLGRLRVRVEAVSGPAFDLSTATGRYLADVVAGGDTRESEEKGERVARAALARAKEGRANGAALYGWKRIYEHDDRGQVTGFHDVEDPEPAAVVREIVRRIADGEGLRSIAADLNAREVPAPSGREDVPWRHTTVRKIALRPANIGKRVYHGQVVGDAAWPALVDPDAHDKAVTALEDRGSAGGGLTAFPPQERRWLLTYGVGECGVCGAILRVANRRRKLKRGPVTYTLYVCDDAGCVGRGVEPVDELVGAVVVGRLSKPDAAGLLDGDGRDPAAAAADLAADLRMRLNIAADQYAEGGIDAEQLERISAKLKPKIEAAEREANRERVRVVEVPEVHQLTGDQAAEVWKGLEVARRRAVLEVLGLRVKIMPTRQGPGFRPEDVHIEWGTA